MRAAVSGSSGTANGMRSITTSDSASPGTSTPSQKLCVASSTEPMRSRSSASSTWRGRSPCTSSGNGSVARRWASATRRLRKLVNSSSARPLVIAHSSAARVAAASAKRASLGSGRSAARYSSACSA